MPVAGGVTGKSTGEGTGESTGDGTGFCLGIAAEGVGVLESLACRRRPPTNRAVASITF